MLRLLRRFRPGSRRINDIPLSIISIVSIVSRTPLIPKVSMEGEDHADADYPAPLAICPPPTTSAAPRPLASGGGRCVVRRPPEPSGKREREIMNDTKETH
jgi:hypothetical protein